jgi:hypothetical protein
MLTHSRSLVSRFRHIIMEGSFDNSLDSSDFLAVRIRPAELHKCPRCWTYTSETAETLCGRCADAWYVSGTDGYVF